MKLETLKKAWTEKNGGDIFIDPHYPGVFQVTYKKGGKCYQYKCKSVYALAEKLNVIPRQKHDESDYNAFDEASNIISALENGQSVVTTSPIFDTVRYMINSKYNHTGKQAYLFTSVKEYRDEWDRTITETTYHGFGLFTSYEEFYKSEEREKYNSE